MAKSRSYKLLCPIARALDRIGDRWTLLILRDLHAGPARFTDLQRGLTSVAANLLTERLGKLVADGLVVKADGGHGTSVYELTDLGARTRDILFELALFGARFEPEGEVVAPGNLRTVTTTLGAAARRVVVPGMNFRVAFIVDGENMALNVENSVAQVLYGPCVDPDLIFSTTYADLIAVSEGEMTLDRFARKCGKLEVRTPGTEKQFQKLMSAIIHLLND
ncbi:winged helix-turn-helix transcriptional regulator [Oricola cellulosilytica]|uniref:Transcriptional regulator n=1 Tax=Oricola cellulosilytica TaxID=1429082 RepID=A0A4R0PDZ9_9HYPH|nr:helix-turn-helix domain-containing protein [Oricola cellulosilytica]TCD14425.1 transcriptional regulator [Oricola cellulosilytica]